jgi:hypothetical protein
MGKANCGVAIGNDGRGWMVVRISPQLAEYYESLASRRGITLSQMSESWLKTLQDADRHIRTVAGRRQSMQAEELARELGEYLAGAAIALDTLPDLIAPGRSSLKNQKRRAVPNKVFDSSCPSGTSLPN